MLDRNLLRKDPDRVREAASAKGEPCPVEEWAEADGRRREILAESEELRRRRNELSSEVAGRKRAGEDADAQIAESREVGGEISRLEKELRKVDAAMAELELAFPNIPDEDVPRGEDESDNILLDSWGEPAELGFEPRPHWELLGGMLDVEASGRVAGANFALMRGRLARLQRRLIQWMCERHAGAGMEEVWTPFVATGDSMRATGQIPKLEADMYRVEGDDLYLIPTGEVPLTNIYRGQLLDEDQLPLQLFGYTPCFRREAGSYGKETRGLNRVHQFEKVELVWITHPDRSDEAHGAMTEYVCEMLQELGIPYRVQLLCTGDLSFAAARCHDLEIWAAGQKRWLEVSSVSNFRDFQARRGGIRFRPEGGGKPVHVHTLNGSALALPRLMAALVENHQTPEGESRLPDFLEQ
ncbi:MAG: serine--tRNA ligase [Candidatus Fermentibacteraceae bacterium]